MDAAFEITAPAFCDPGSTDRSNGSKVCSREDVLQAIASRPLAFEPWTRPLYSNTGFDVLGWTIAEAANRKAKNTRQGSDVSVTVEDLLQTDVFEPLGMEDTFFYPVPTEKKKNIAIPAQGVPHMADWDFTASFNPYITRNINLMSVLAEYFQRRMILPN